MDLVNELSGELALAFLVEKKYSERLNANDILTLIGRVKEVLLTLPPNESPDRAIMPCAVVARTISY